MKLKIMMMKKMKARLMTMKKMKAKFKMVDLKKVVLVKTLKTTFKHTIN